MVCYESETTDEDEEDNQWCEGTRDELATYWRLHGGRSSET